MPDALFEPLGGEHFLPTLYSRGPWSPDALHGGPPAALLARAVERFDGGEAMFVARLTVELLRPVPIAPLALSTRLLRPGRKVQLVEATLRGDANDVARAVGLRIRRQAVTLPEMPPSDPPPFDLPEGGKLSAPPPPHDGFHNLGVEHRFVRGAFTEPGPATDWIRLAVPLLAGEETSPLCRVCAAADFGNGISSVLTWAYTYINPDLTVYLHRYPRGEWICLDAITRVEPHGVGLAESRLYDREGAFGRSTQALIVERPTG
jgi:hypothetical protein